MNKANRNYSYLIHPITLVIDLLLLNSVFYFFFEGVEYKFLLVAFLSISWCVLSWITGFYKVYRYSLSIKIVAKLFRQFIGLSFIVAALNGMLSRFDEPARLISFTVVCMLLISGFKFSLYFILKYFRKSLGGNYRNVVFVGNTKELKALYKLFNTKKDMGYRVLCFFDKEESFHTIESFVSARKVQEIFVCFDYIVEARYTDLLAFADTKRIVLKYVPNETHLLTNSFKVHYYNYIPVISKQELPLDTWGNRLFKRVFDIVFSILVLVFIFSWLAPILILLIKLESDGPIFFKQRRTGLNEVEFECYKFRSMKTNVEANQQHAIKRDSRVTRIGAFMRKTSIDELPQFFNVLKGDMSVVGPRPHMVLHTQEYSKRVKRFMLRHLVKPGITGMAQTHGYRGEIENDRDIINRFKYDLFYLENWSIWLDLKIISLTITNIFKGEDKAY